MLISNTHFQSQFISELSSEKPSSFLKRFTDIRATASKMNAVLIKLMVNYVNILIDHLIMAGQNINVDFEEKTVNLVSLNIGDLMRSRIQCS